MEFKNTYGQIFTEQEMIDSIIGYVKKNPNYDYKIFIGSDSQKQRKRRLVYVTAVVVYKCGKEARLFYNKKLVSHKGYIHLSERIMNEVQDSIDVTKLIETSEIPHIIGGMDNIEVHVDVGENGKSSDYIKMAMGWINGSGYNCRVKPNAPGASVVADRYTKK